MFESVVPARLEVLWMDDLLNPEQNSNLDGVIGSEVARGERRPTLRIWRASHQPGIAVSRKDVSTPRGQAAMQSLRESGFQVTVRQTGGTAVPQGPGVIHYSYILPRTMNTVSTDDYYRLLCHPFIDWLRQFGVPATTGALEGSYCDGSYNVLVGRQKLIGTAQAWRGGLAGMASRHPGYVLAHACLMVDVDFNWSTDLINRFYEMVGNTYRVDLDTCTDLKRLLPRALSNVSAEEATDWAGQQLANFFVAYFEDMNVDVVIRDTPMFK